MNSDKTPLVNKLTLLVLSLILVCLVLLVARSYQKPALQTDALATADSTLTVIEETQPAPAPTPTRTPLVTQRPAPNNAVRRTLPARPAARVATERPAASPTFPEARTALVNLPGSEGADAFRDSPGGGTSGDGTSLLGIVTLTGTPKPEIPIDLGPTCGSINPEKVTTRHFVVSPEGGLANVLVYLKSRPSSDITYVASGPPSLLDQVGCMFEPYVMGVVVGQKILFRNSDPVLHNIHATPKLNREFNIGQSRQGQINEKSFNTPELFVRIKCDVHPWMFAYVNVMTHPFFAITDANGIFRLPGGLPPGSYTVSAAHLKAGALTKDITIKTGETKALHFAFSIDPAVQSQARMAQHEVIRDALPPR